MAIHYRVNGKDYCVYGHYKDSGEPFYIGISGNRERPYNLEDRTDLHKRIANKYGCTVKILADNLTMEEAVTIESELILSIGRICTKTGPLANFKAHHYEHYERGKGRHQPLKRTYRKRPKKAYVDSPLLRLKQILNR